MSSEIILPSSFGIGFLPILFGLGFLLLNVAASVLVFRHARRRGASDGFAALAAAACFLTSPLGFLVYVVLALTGLVDSIVESLRGGGGASGGAAVPQQQPPAGWYDDPDGEGQRWWDGTAWTEHSQRRG